MLFKLQCLSSSDKYSPLERICHKQNILFMASEQAGELQAVYKFACKCFLIPCKTKNERFGGKVYTYFHSQTMKMHRSGDKGVESPEAECQDRTWGALSEILLMAQVAPHFSLLRTSSSLYVQGAGQRGGMQSKRVMRISALNTLVNHSYRV